MPSQKKQTIILTPILIMVVIFLGALVLGLSHFVNKKHLIFEASELLDNVSESKAEQIRDNFVKMQADLEVIEAAEEVKELLKTETVVAEQAVIEDVNEQSSIISKQVENYFRARPDLSLADLVQSQDFRRIISQPVGKNGYSTLNEFNSRNIVIHKQSDFEGTDIRDMVRQYSSVVNTSDTEQDPAIYSQISDLVGNYQAQDISQASGFYGFQELDGQVSRKYGSFKKVSAPTSEGIELFVSTTGYVNDYKVVDEKSEYLENFALENDYYNLVLISADGYVVYMSEIEAGYGTNLNWETNLKSGLAQNYLAVKDTDELDLSGPYIRSFGDIYPRYSAMAPVYEQDILLGYVAIIDHMNRIYQVLADDTELGQKGQSYLVNEDLLLISPLKNQEYDMFVQQVETENSEECIEDLIEKGEEAYQEEEEEKGEDVRISEDYQGVETIGTDYPLPSLDWCLLVELDEAETIEKPLNKIFLRTLLWTVSAVVALTVAILFSAKHIHRVGSQLVEEIKK